MSLATLSLAVAVLAAGYSALAPRGARRRDRRGNRGLAGRGAGRSHGSLEIQGEPLPADAAAAIPEACRRIAALAASAESAEGAGGAAAASADLGDRVWVRWLAAPELPVAFVDLLAAGEPLHRAEWLDLPADVLIPALGADRALVGAFAIDGRLADRSSYPLARDLAGRVAVAVQRAQAVAELHDARPLAALGQLTAAIAHDIRTPLTSISLNVQILRRKLALSDDDREHLDIAIDELARLDRAVGEILALARPARLARQPVDIGELLEAIRQTLVPVLHQRGIGFHIEPLAPPGGPGMPSALVVHGDPLRLRQALTNLIDNAAQASRPGGDIALRAAAIDGCRIAIEVEDRGSGIRAADQPRIFEPFFTTRPDGTGLGLAIVHKIIRAHGGEISVRSRLDSGSTFTIALPAAPPEEP